MSEVLNSLNHDKDPNLLVGFDTSDDSAVYRLNDNTAIVTTADFITPPVDDPYWFGQIAAANSLSDVYAMGAKPLMAINLVMFPEEKLDMSILKEILNGGHGKIAEAEALMVGGHSVNDLEPKYGLSVIGLINPDAVITICGAKPGDSLILTKPIGTGVLFNACRDRKLPYSELEVILPQIAYLNKKAIEVALNFDINSCTDISGYGIVGHSLEMAKGSGVQINLYFNLIPLYPNVLDMYKKGIKTGGNKANMEMSEDFLRIEPDLSYEKKEILFDPQTSGGLLISLPESRSDILVKKLKEAGIEASVKVGNVEATSRPSVRIL